MYLGVRSSLKPGFYLPQEDAMGIRDRYEHGVFSWVDLATADPEAAKTFYSQLFDWRFEDIPVPARPTLWLIRAIARVPKPAWYWRGDSPDRSLG